MGIGRFDVGNLPVAPARATHADLAFDRRSLLDVAELHAAGLEDDIAANYPSNVEENLRRHRLIDDYGNRGGPRSEEGRGIEYRSNGPFFVRLQRGLDDIDAGAAAA